MVIMLIIGLISLLPVDTAAYRRGSRMPISSMSVDRQSRLDRLWRGRLPIDFARTIGTRQGSAGHR